MDGIRPEDIGMTAEEMRAKQDEVKSKTVDGLLRLIKAINTAEDIGGDPTEGVAFAAVYIIAATRLIRSLRKGMMKHMDDCAESMPVNLMLAAIGSHKAFVALEDTLVRITAEMVPECLGGMRTKGTFVVMTSIFEAMRLSELTDGEVEENEEK